MTAENIPSEGTPSACLPPALRKPRLRRDEAVQYLELVHGIVIKAPTLANWATRGGGPGFQRLGTTPLYPRTELDAWAERALGPVIHSTSQAD